jgi:hypothetical protein
MTAAGHTRPSKQQRSTVSMRIWTPMRVCIVHICKCSVGCDRGTRARGGADHCSVLGRRSMTAWLKEEARGVVVEWQSVGDQYQIIPGRDPPLVEGSPLSLFSWACIDNRLGRSLRRNNLLLAQATQPVTLRHGLTPRASPKEGQAHWPSMNSSETIVIILGQGPQTNRLRRTCSDDAIDATNG